MIEFIKRLFGQSSSSATAKERLRFVLMTDHLELAPDMIEAMKREFVEVISRYVEVDRDKIDVSFERQDRTLAMLANIPILSVNRPPANETNVAAAPKAASPAAKTTDNGIAVRRRRRRKKTQARNNAHRPATAT
jgi:cell division topological specificity factor